jgi:pheromone shutdown-related protein TraB
MNDDNIYSLTYQDKEIILIGTAHVSRESAESVEQLIEEARPDTVSIELCQSRYQSITQKKRWQDSDLLKVIKEKKAFLLLLNLMLAYFQKKIGKKFGINPGEEMIRAIKTAEGIGADVHLADRDIRITLSRIWYLMGFWTKLKLLFQFIASAGDVDTIKEEDIEKMKKDDVLDTLLSEIGESLPEVRQILIDERDQYLAQKIRTAPGRKIVAVVGAGHVPGIRKYWDKTIDLVKLEQMPPKGKFITLLKWIVPLIIMGIIIIGFFVSGTTTGTQMIKWWVIANAVLAGAGATIALAHPVTVVSAVIASPLTSLNPMIAAGWVAGLVEAFLRRPKVRDFENLPEDISSLGGFWKNKITRILMVVVFTNLGSSLGAFVAIPLMVKVMT